MQQPIRNIAILAHVDAGKTTLSERILFSAGEVRRPGKVEEGLATMDYLPEEKDRGITIFSKPAVFNYKGQVITLLDTPGHVDFSTETERAIWALDFAILLISGTDGVQAHTKTLFSLLEKNNVPTVIFINKADMTGFNQDFVINDLKEKLSKACHLLSNQEDIAMEDEAAMEEYLDKANASHMSSVKVIHGIGTGTLRTALRNRMKKLSYVKSFKDGDYYDGGSAVTIVEFK